MQHDASELPRLGRSNASLHVVLGTAYIVQGEVEVDGMQYIPGHLLVFEEGTAVTLGCGSSGAHLVLLGGDALDVPRFLSWSFVARSKALIENAQQRGIDQTFLKVPRETEFTPLLHKD